MKKRLLKKKDISTKIVKLNADIFRNKIRKDFNNCLEKGEFSFVIKHADVASVPKKGIKSDKANYRPFNILSNLYKIYRQLIYHQLYEHFNSILSS